MSSFEPDRLLRDALGAAIDAARPERCVPPALPARPAGRTVVIGAGKAAAAMARAVEEHWDGELSGTVVTARGHAVACSRIEVIESEHPVPEEAGLRAAGRMLDLVRALGPDDLVLCLLSGGASALLPWPAVGLSLSDKKMITRELLRSGAAIGEINTVRRHLSGIKGGRLGVACHPARLVTLAISDVPGDVPADIGSGPTVADPTTCADALVVLDRYRDRVAVPGDVRAALQCGAWESVKPGDPRLARAEFRIVAAPQASLEAAARVAEACGVRAVILSDRVEGEAREVGGDMAAGLGAGPSRATVPPPCLLLSGGETTVTVRGGGCGGRNVEFLLGARHWHSAPRPGARARSRHRRRGWARRDRRRRLAPRHARPRVGAGPGSAGHLDDNDAHKFFGALGDWS